MMTAFDPFLELVQSKFSMGVGRAKISARPECATCEHQFAPDLSRAVRPESIGIFANPVSVFRHMIRESIHTAQLKPGAVQLSVLVTPSARRGFRPTGLTQCVCASV